MNHTFPHVWPRRDLGLLALVSAAAPLGWFQPQIAQAKKKRKKRRNLCWRNGTSCRRSGKSCRASFCLTAPFTNEAVWTITADHDSYLFLPPQNDSTGPFPLITYSCNESNSTCEGEYPFACVDGDEANSGSELTTVYKLLKGRYEYWIELEITTPAAQL